MMVETDILHAHVKTSDLLKPTPEKLLRRIVRGEFGVVSQTGFLRHSGIGLGKRATIIC